MYVFVWTKHTCSAEIRKAVVPTLHNIVRANIETYVQKYKKYISRNIFLYFQKYKTIFLKVYIFCV